MRHPNSERFHELIQEIADLHDTKQEDYGAADDPFANVRSSQDFGVAPWIGALIRLHDKITRLKAFARKGSLANESVDDSLRDIAVYALIALVLYQQEAEANRLEEESGIVTPNFRGNLVTVNVKPQGCCIDGKPMDEDCCRNPDVDRDPYTTG